MEHLQDADVEAARMTWAVVTDWLVIKLERAKSAKITQHVCTYH